MSEQDRIRELEAKVERLTKEVAELRAHQSDYKDWRTEPITHPPHDVYRA